MTVEETKQRILTDDQFVLDEVARMQVLYGLKDEKRYEIPEEYTPEIAAESVADHVYAMHALTLYFQKLEDPDGLLDMQRVSTMIQFHDIDEIETGDKLGYRKTAEDRTRERTAEDVIIQSLPELMQNEARTALVEYNAKETPEALFARAIDKIEPTFHIYCDNGKKIAHYHKTTAKEHYSLKDPYTKAYPCIYRFNRVVGAQMEKEGFYS